MPSKLVDLGCEVISIDSGSAQVDAARKLGLNAYVMNAEELTFHEEFDAVFSNADDSLRNAAGMAALIKSARRWFRRWSVAGWMAKRLCPGITRLPDARPAYLREVRATLEPQLRDAEGIWIADYTRLRFAATK